MPFFIYTVPDYQSDLGGIKRRVILDLSPRNHTDNPLECCLARAPFDVHLCEVDLDNRKPCLARATMRWALIATRAPTQVSAARSPLSRAISPAVLCCPNPTPLLHGRNGGRTRTACTEEHFERIPKLVDIKRGSWKMVGRSAPRHDEYPCSISEQAARHASPCAEQICAETGRAVPTQQLMFLHII